MLPHLPLAMVVLFAGARTLARSCAVEPVWDRAITAEETSLHLLPLSQRSSKRQGSEPVVLWGASPPSPSGSGRHHEKFHFFYSMLFGRIQEGKPLYAWGEWVSARRLFWRRGGRAFRIFYPYNPGVERDEALQFRGIADHPKTAPFLHHNRPKTRENWSHRTYRR